MHISKYYNNLPGLGLGDPSFEIGWLVGKGKVETPSDASL